MDGVDTVFRRNSLKKFIDFIGRHKLFFILALAFGLYCYNPDLYKRSIKKVAEFLHLSTTETQGAREDLRELKKDIK